MREVACAQQRTSIVLKLLVLQMYDVGGHSIHEVLQWAHVGILTRGCVFSNRVQQAMGPSTTLSTRSTNSGTTKLRHGKACAAHKPTQAPQASLGIAGQALLRGPACECETMSRMRLYFFSVSSSHTQASRSCTPAHASKLTDKPGLIEWHSCSLLCLAKHSFVRMQGHDVGELTWATYMTVDCNTQEFPPDASTKQLNTPRASNRSCMHCSGLLLISP